jgi:hypothetical protein
MGSSTLVGHSESVEQFADPRQAHGVASARMLKPVDLFLQSL